MNELKIERKEADLWNKLGSIRILNIIHKKVSKKLLLSYYMKIYSTY
jgi:hypothetical protein